MRVESNRSRMRQVPAAVLMVVLAVAWRAWSGDSVAPRAVPPSFETPLLHAPLDTPLVLTGGFGEYRVGHFHAGLDFGTGKRVGRPVYAPLDGWVERVRASGVGYGRSIYLHAEDGRLLVFGHLDAYAEPLAGYVRAAQDSGGQYEQDLWPEPRRFRVRAGQTIAWTGESGAGGPHLHFEIRRGDMAYHPLRAGLRVADVSGPSLVSLTLEPLDDTSTVNGARLPRTIALGAATESVTVHGRARAVVGARDGVWEGVDRMVPWSVDLAWGGERVEARFDSVSWADDMVEIDYVYDAGRIVGEKGLVLWAPPGFRPRVIKATTPRDAEAGTLRMYAGEEPRELELEARDLAGHVARQRVVVRPGPSAAARGPAPASAGVAVTPAAAAEGAAGSLRWSIPAAGAFEAGRLSVTRIAVRARPSGELTLLGDPHDIRPAGFPLRRPARIAMELPRGETPQHVGLYRAGSEGWELVGAKFDSATRSVEGESRRLGRFALLRDASAPRVAVARVQPGPRTPYSRWAVEARLTEDGSGVQARESWFVVDGRRVATEWDGEQKLLRWRPARSLRPGMHTVQAVVTDKAGRRAGKTFRIRV
jgi:hypothetical protein